MLLLPRAHGAILPQLGNICMAEGILEQPPCPERKACSELCSDLQRDRQNSAASYLLYADCLCTHQVLSNRITSSPSTYGSQHLPRNFGAQTLVGVPEHEDAGDDQCKIHKCESSMRSMIGYAPSSLVRLPPRDLTHVVLRQSYRIPRGLSNSSKIN